jgi:DNA-directed RNA polymerase subunit alpha
LKSIETGIIGWFRWYSHFAVRIAGVSHEIFNYSGVREDILEILLKKGIVLKQNRKYAVWSFKIQGPAVITADLIQLPSNLEIVNPNHYITTISTSNILEIEFKFEHGTGYRLASQAF